MPDDDVKSKSKKGSGSSGTSKYSALNVHVSPAFKSGIKPFGEDYSYLKIVNQKLIEPSDDNVLSVDNVQQYREKTGLLDTEPTIVLMSEFLPLYRNGVDVSESLDFKEKSDLVVARNALIALNQVPTVQHVEDKKAAIEELIRRNNLSTLLRLMSSLYETLKVKNFKSSSLKGNPKFYQAIDFFGDTNISKYTNSKVWQQTLLEMKRVIASYSPQLVAGMRAISDSIYNKDPYVIVGLDGKVTSETKVWINYFNKSEFDSNMFLSNISPVSIKNNLPLVEKRFKTLYIDPEETSTLGIVTPAQKIVESLVEGNRDIALIATVLTKELNYSRALLDLSEKLSTDYGYGVVTADPQSAFDYLVGTFTRSAWSVPKNPAGQGGALSSLAYEIVDRPDGTSFPVLTFESSYVDTDKMTPGGQYYVESSLRTNDGNSFNVENVKTLKRKVGLARDTLGLLQRIVNGDSGVQSNRKNPGGTSAADTKVVESFTSTAEEVPTEDFSAIMSTEDAIVETRPLKLTSSFFKGKGAEAPVGKQKGFAPHQLVRNIYSQFDFLRKIYYNLYLSTQPLGKPYDNSDESKLERLTASLLKSCVLPNKYMKDKAPKLKSYLYMLLTTYTGQFEDGDARDFLTSGIMSTMQEHIHTEDPPPQVKIIVSDTADYVDACMSPVGTLEKGIFSSKVWKTLIETMASYLNIPALDSSGLTGYSKIDSQTLSMTFFDLILRIVASMTPDEFYGCISIPAPPLSKEPTEAEIDYYRRADLGKLLEAANKRLGEIQRRLDEKPPEAENNNLVAERQFVIYPNIKAYNAELEQINKRIAEREKAYDKKSSEEGIQISAEASDEMSKFEPTRMHRWPLSLKSTKVAVAGYFTDFLGGNKEPQKISTALSSYVRATVHCHEENERLNFYLNILKEYLDKLQSATNALERELLSESTQRLFTEFFLLYASDPNMSQEMRIELFNSSMTQEQIMMRQFILSEYKDRLTDDLQIVNKVPIFRSFPENYQSFLPMDSLSLVSYDFLSSFFRGEQFQFAKGNNKKIVSVGIPNALFGKLRDNDNLSTLEKSRIRDNIVRIKVYRVNRLTPEVVFLPQSFEFEMGRFPTRMLKNWEAQTLYSKDTFDLSNIPTKKLDYTTGEATLHKNLADAIEKYLDTSQVPSDRFSAIYRNHALSFLLEEYLRWYTDTDFDESRYYNYTEFDDLVRTYDAQYSTFYETIREKTNVEGAVGIARFSTTNGEVTKTIVDTASTKGYVVDLTNTLKIYLRNETLLLDTKEYQQRALYPKKFDRVFNVMIDPDDFKIDIENSIISALDDLKEKGILVGSSGEYKLRDSTPDDTCFDDYFVTIEPFDYGVVP